MNMIYHRPSPEALRAVFPLALPDRLAALPVKPGHRNPTVLNIGVSAGALFDHGYSGPYDEDAFERYMIATRKEPMRLRPQASLPLSLLDLNYLTPNQDPLVVLHVMTRLSGPSYARLRTSMESIGMYDHDFQNDFVPVSHFESQQGKKGDFRRMVKKSKDLGIDFFLSSSMQLAEMLNQAGIGAGVNIDDSDLRALLESREKDPGDLLKAREVGLYDPLRPRDFRTDGDGCAYSDFYEKKFQEIYERSGNDIAAAKDIYYEYVMRTLGADMAQGPTLALFHGLALARSVFEATDEKPNPLNLGLVTTRDHRGSSGFHRFFLEESAQLFLARRGLRFDELDFVSGNIKNQYLAGALAMFEDGIGHLTRMDLMQRDDRPKSRIYIPFGTKHDRLLAGQQVIADGRGTTGGSSGGVDFDVGSMRDS